MNKKHFNKSLAFRFRRFARKAYSAFNSMHKAVTIGVVTGCALTSLAVPKAKAQDSITTGYNTSMEKELEEVMVTASRVETPIEQTAQLVTIITKEQIAQAPVQSIQDLLVYAANIDVIQRGGHGVQADISIRGGSLDQNAILLNGINLSNPHTGHYSFDIPINLSDIERIEIIHGPSALVYGASAFSGGINIITKKSIDHTLYADVTSGMHNFRSIEVRGARRQGIANSSFSASNSSSDGYIANSDYDIYNMLWQTRFRWSDKSKIDLQLGYNDKKYGANTFYSAKFPNQYEHTTTYVGSLKGEFGSALKIVPIIYWNRHHDQFDLIKGTDFGRNHHRNDTYGANLIFAYFSKLGNTSLGGELRKEDIMSSVLGKPMTTPHRKYTMYDDRINSSIALEHTVNLPRTIISAGVLLNHNTLLHNEYKFYPSLSIAYELSDELKILTSWRKSVRMPTFTDLYYSTETHDGNTNLKPEKSEALDLSFKYTTPVVNAYVNGFVLWGKDMIDWMKDNPSDTKWASWNFTKINTQGIEMGARINLYNLTRFFGEKSNLSVDYTRMNQTSDTKGYITLYSFNYLRDKCTIRFNHQVYKGLTAAWFFRYQKRMGTYEKYENLIKVGDEPYPAFSTLDLKLDYQIKDISFNLSLSNLYNTCYFDRGNVPQAGFWLSGGVKYILK